MARSSSSTEDYTEPVIDVAAGTLYAVAMSQTQDETQNYHRLYALDITTGLDRPGSPVEIKASISPIPGYKLGGGTKDNAGNLLLDMWHLNRPGLLLQNGRVYIAFGALSEDKRMYHGWVIAYDASTLQQVGVFNVSPDFDQKSENTSSGFGSKGAGIWQSGMGLAADPNGNVYCTTGNGPFNADQPQGRDFGNSLLKLGQNLNLIDFFTPCDQCLLLTNDVDLSSGGVMIIPDEQGRAKLLVACGKEGRIYVIDQTNLGKYTPPPSNCPNWTWQNQNQNPCTDKVVNNQTTIPGVVPGDSSGVRGGPAYYRDSAGREFVYYCANGTPLICYELSSNGSLNQVNQSSDNMPAYTSPIPVISSNGSTPGTAIVWVMPWVNKSFLKLVAYDATNLSIKLKEVNPNPPLMWEEPNKQTGEPFLVPTVVNGKVYVASAGVLTVFGL